MNNNNDDQTVSAQSDVRDDLLDLPALERRLIQLESRTVAELGIKAGFGAVELCEAGECGLAFEEFLDFVRASQSSIPRWLLDEAIALTRLMELEDSRSVIAFFDHATHRERV